MAITIGQVQAITHDLVLKSLADNVYQSAAGLRRMYSKRVKLDGGNDIGAPVISGAVDNTTGGWYQGASALTDAEKDDITRAVVEWKQLYETVLISKLDLMKNSGASQVLQLLASKIKIAEMRIKSRLSTGIFHDGSNSLVFNGLDEIIHATGSYGGLAISDILDESGNNAWLGRVKDNSGTNRALAGSLIQNAMGAATEDESRPSVAFMKQNVFDELWAILEPHQRLMVEDASFSGAGHDQKKVLQYNGIPFLVDSHATANTMYFVNEEFTKLYVHSQEDLAAQSFKQLEDVNAVKERMLLTGNLLCAARRFNAKLKDINVAV
jgi:hypothetical protein